MNRNLIFSIQDSANYSVTSSQDGRTAYVTPAIPDDQLEGRIGLIFLKENPSEDTILVFDAAPEYSGDTMIIPLKDTEDITVNELFSDMKLVINPVEPQNSSSYVNEDGENIVREEAMYGVTPDFSYNRNLTGTNWKAKITNYSAQAPKASKDINALKGRFNLLLDLRFALDFEIVSYGKTGKRETADIATVKIPIGGASLSVKYSMQVCFEDDVSLNMKGRLRTDLEFEIGTKSKVKNFTTNVTISNFELADPAKDSNKDINFYIGASMLAKGGLFEIDIPVLWIKTITIGPVLSLNNESSGGCYIRANLSKDQWNKQDLSSTQSEGNPDYSKMPDIIHSCAESGKEGCLGLQIREVNAYKITFSVNLYFYKWGGDVNKKDESTVNNQIFHVSLTYGKDLIAGSCQNYFKKVMAHVLYEESKEPVAGATVTNEDPIVFDKEATEQIPFSNVTDSQGYTALYMPAVNTEIHTFAADKKAGNTHLVGSVRESNADIDKNNRIVEILLADDEKVDFHIKINWTADLEEKDIPESVDLVVQKQPGNDGEWQSEKTVTLRKDENWETEFKTDKHSVVGDDALLNNFRVVLSGEYEQIEDDTVAAAFTIPTFTDVSGVAEPEHQTRYYLESETTLEEDSISVQIGATAVSEITLNKKWKLPDSSEKAESVYLALEEKPETGWEYAAEQEGVPAGWNLIRDPFSGSTTTLGELVSADLLTIEDIDNIENVPWTIANVSEDHNWSVTYTVPKYRNGIKMQFMGSELDSAVIKNLFQNEYKVVKILKFSPGYSYISYPEKAARGFNDWQYCAEILNTCDDEHTISGVISWVYDKERLRDYWTLEDLVKTKVTIHVYNKEGEEVGAVECDPDDYKGKDVWTWSLSGEAINRKEEYTIREEFDDKVWTFNESLAWSERYSGLDVTNYMVGGSLQGTMSVKVIFEDANDRESLPDSIAFKVHAGSQVYEADKEFGTPYVLKKSNDYYYGEVYFPCYEGELSVETEPVSGWIPEYKEPVITRRDLDKISMNKFTFVVVYRHQKNLLLTINKQWDKQGDNDAPIPDYIDFDVYRDGELIVSDKLSTINGTVSISKDRNYRYLLLLRDDGKRYNYTVKEKPIDGFTSSVESVYEEKETDPGDKLCLNITNKWVGKKNVSINGTVSWKGDEGREDLRPDSVKISVINAAGELTKSVDVPVSDNGTYHIDLLPGTGAEGEYIIEESHISGYTTTYSAPVFIDGVWQIDVTNELTGVYPVTVKKTMKGDHTEEDAKETFHFTIQNHEQAQDDNEGAQVMILCK